MIQARKNVPAKGISCLNARPFECKIDTNSRRWRWVLRVFAYSHEREAEGEFSQGDTLLAVIRRLGFDPEASCNGRGKCGKCRVEVSPDSRLSPPSDLERKLLGEFIDRGVRLACQTRILGDCRVYIKGQVYGRIETVDRREFGNIFPYIRKERSSLAASQGVDILSATIGEISRDHIDTTHYFADFSGRDVFLYFRPGKLVAITDRKASNLGVSIDIGTTTIASVLVDLDSGQVLARESMMNPQRRFGHDVISRITHTVTEENGLKQLTGLIRNAIAGLVKSLASAAGVDREEINQLVIAGNTTMNHLLLGLPVRSIAIAPFLPFCVDKQRRTSRELGIELSPFAEVLVLPSISGYIGSDIVAGILATDLLDREDELLIDLGTNGEIVLSTGRKLICCSTAAGPAFEGGNISCGSGSIKGAIERVSFSNGLSLETIGNSTPKSICGSGLISIVATFLKERIIDTSGKFSDPSLWPKELKSHFKSDANAFTIAEGVQITLKDLRQFQLAKAAVRTGVEVLLQKYRERSLKRVNIAGGFGRGIEVEDLFTTGILPPSLETEVSIVGNTSLEGCLRFLLYRNSIDRVDEIIDRSQYIELSNLEEFRNMYVEFMKY